MENKVNIAELLKDCPIGMELYSPIFGNVYLDKIRPHLAIVVTTDKEQGNIKEEFLYDGRYGMNGECMLFPSKDKTTWEGFEPPIKFKDGDILFVESIFPFIVIYKENENEECECFYKYVAIKNSPDSTHIFNDDRPLAHKNSISTIRFATEEEKQKLFDVIKANGYKWNAETKTLEKLIVPKFKVGDKIRSEHFLEERTIKTCEEDGYWTTVDSWIKISDQDDWELVPGEIKLKFKIGDRIKTNEFEYIIVEIKDGYYLTACGNKILIKNQDYFKLVPDMIKPKFKVGDKVVRKGGICVPLLITKVGEEFYYSNNEDIVKFFRITDQDEWELAPDNKFDISTLIPFETKVLVRNTEENIWKPSIFGCYVDKTSRYYVLGGTCWSYCIPYEGNEHLRGKTDDCDKRYKTWEE